MSYFIFKGIGSKDKVIVESLPPIVKPPKRYTIREIDGSDEATIETTGYKIYEKIIPIGFWENNIDEVYNWLDGSGQLILSNEPDKYYDAYILNQIDYEKALRFKKAKISFMVQPYKHAIREEETTARAVYNRGNVDSLPLMTIYGSGSVGVKINNVLACTVTINEYITLDSQSQEAYKDTASQNRSMSGSFPKLIPGTNTITFTGNVTNVITLARSRWI